MVEKATQFRSSGESQFTLAFFLSMGSAALFALQFPIIKIALKTLTSIQAATLEALYTILFCFLWQWNRSSGIRLFKNKMLFFGGVSNALGLIFLFESIRLLNPATVGFIGRLYFVYTSLIALFYFKEYPSVIELFAVPGTILGLFLFSFHDFDTTEILGVGIAMLYPLFFAAQNTIIKKSMSHLRQTQIILYNKIWSFIFLFIYGLFREQYHFFKLSLEGTSLIGISSFLSTFLGLILFLRSLKLTKFSVANIVKGSEVFFILLFSYFFFPQPLSELNVIGVFIVFLCIVALGFEQWRQTKKEFHPA